MLGIRILLVLWPCAALVACGCGRQQADPFAEARAFRDDQRAAHAAYLAGDYRRAERLFIRLLERYSNTYDARVLTDQAQDVWRRGYHDLGWVRVALGEPDKAIENLTSAAHYIDLHTTFLPQSIGFVCRLAGRDAEAESWFRRSVAEPSTLDNRIASLSLALLYCETGRTLDQRAQERRVAELDDDLARPPRDLYGPGDASYWNYDQIEQEAHYRRRLAAASGDGDCAALTFRLLVALEGASYRLQASDRYEAQLRTIEETIGRGRLLFGRDHPLVAEAMHQWAMALWQVTDRFAYTSGPGRHRIGPNDMRIAIEQAEALDPSNHDGRQSLRLRAAEERRRGRLEEAEALLNEARAILTEHPAGYEGLRARIDRDLEKLRRDQGMSP